MRPRALCEHPPSTLQYSFLDHFLSVDAFLDDFLVEVLFVSEAPSFVEAFFVTSFVLLLFVEEARFVASGIRDYFFFTLE